MEERGYSYGLCNMAVGMLGGEPQVMDELIDFIYDQAPTENELIERLAQ